MTSSGEELLTHIITDEDTKAYRRLDQCLADRTEYSRTFLKHLFESELIYAEELKLSLNKMPKIGTEITIEVPPPLPSHLLAEKIPLDILYEDEFLVIVNKPAGMVTHPAPGNPSGTLANAILYHCQDLSGIGDEKRPGIVHRLDKGTSGVMVVAKERKTHEDLVLMFSKHELERRYEAIIVGKPTLLSGTIESTIGRHKTHRQKMAPNVRNGKRAVTHYHTIKNYGPLTHMELKLETGRTHQIRVHLSALLHTPIFLDPLYGNPKDHLKKVSPAIFELVSDYPHPLLHAKKLAFIHPRTQKELNFTVAPPPLFSELLLRLETSI